MSAPVNIRRDGFWTNPLVTARLTFGTPTAPLAGNPGFNNDNVVKFDQAAVMIAESLTMSALQVACAGVQMNHIQHDNMPLRIQAKTLESSQLIIGWCDAVTTGVDDAINEAFFMPFLYDCDCTIVVPPPTTGYEGRALAVAVGVYPFSAKSAQDTIMSLSVQSVGISPPTMALGAP